MWAILGNKDDSYIIKIAAYAALFIPIMIMLLKLSGTMITGSLSMQAALIDSISDIISSIFVIASVYISQRPENENYQFGFSKVESLGALVQSIFIFASGIFFVIETYHNLFYQQEVRHSWAAMILICISMTLLLLLTKLQKYVINKTDSLIIKSSFLHFHMDVFIDIGVLASIFVGYYFKIYYIDSVFGISFTAYILFNAYKLVKTALDDLIDRSFSKEDMSKLNNIIKSYDKFKVTKILTRRSGVRKFINIQIMMDSDFQLGKVCSITENLKNDICKIFKNSMIYVDVISDKKS